MVFGGVAIGEIGYAADLPAAARIYALGGDPVGMFKSIDGGLTWTEIMGHGLTEGTTMDVLSVAGGDDVIYALDANAANLVKSTDGGTTWSDCTSLSTAPIPASVSIVDADTVYVASADSIKKTINGGTSWSTWGTGTDYPYLSAAKGGSKVWLSSIVSFLTTQKLRYNADHTGQETFNHTVSMDTIRAVSDTFAFVVTGLGDTADTLLKISGTTVTDITPGAADPLNWIDAWSPDAGTTIIARLNGFTGSAIYKSTTGGSSWSLVAIDDTLFVNANFVGPWLTVDPNDATKWWAIGEASSSADSTVWYSTDTGDTWTPVVVATGQIQLRSVCAASG